jgi:hypothetical protein
MKVTYTSANGRLAFEFESETDKKLVTQLAHIQEVFEEPACGCCKSERIRFDVREFDKNLYYKLLCDDCGATLDFGQHKTGDTLFVKRFEKDTREPLPNRGWYQYGKSPDPTPTKPSGPSAPPTPKPTPSKPVAAATSAPPTTPTPVTSAINGMNGATSLSNLDAWKNWALKITDLSAVHRENLEEAYRQNTERIAAGKPPSRRTG